MLGSWKGEEGGLFDTLYSWYSLLSQALDTLVFPLPGLGTVLATQDHNAPSLVPRCPQLPPSQALRAPKSRAQAQGFLGCADVTISSYTSFT